MPSTGTPTSNTACGAVGGSAVGHRLRSTGEHDSARAEGAHFVAIHVPRQDLAVDAALAHAAGDELRVLRAEVEDQDAVGVDIGRSQRQCGPALS